MMTIERQSCTRRTGSFRERPIPQLQSADEERDWRHAVVQKVDNVRAQQLFFLTLIHWRAIYPGPGEHLISHHKD